MDTILIQILFCFIFGTIIGSFLNVLIWRLPKEKSLLGRSECPHCKHKLSWFDLFPLLSYISSKGKCRYCKKKISPRYLLIELATGILFVLPFFHLVPNDISDWLVFGQVWFLMSVLVVVFMIDLEHYLILDKVIFPATAVIIAVNLISDLNPISSWQSSLVVNSLVGMVAGFIPFYLLWVISKGKWIGLGDAKFGLFLGAVFGFPQVWVCLLLSFLIGSLVAIPLLITGKKQLQSKLPLGVFLAISAVFTWYYGIEIMSWYLNLIGVG